MAESPLFNAKRIEDVKKSRRDGLLSDLDELDVLGELGEPATAERLRAAAQLQLPVLDRAGADLTTSEQGAGLNVTVVVPVTGDGFLLDVRPSTFSSNPPAGRVNRSYRSGEVAPELVFEGKFTRDAGAADIKGWAAKHVGAIEQYIEWLRADVQMHNADVDKMIEEGLVRRRSELTALRRLNDGLSGGI